MTACNTTLWYSCYVLQSSIITEIQYVQWIYKNFIGWWTKPGLVCSAWFSPINFSIFMQSFLTRASIKTVEIPHSCTQVTRVMVAILLFYHWTSCTNFMTIWGNNRLSFVSGDMIDLLIVCYEWEDEQLCPCLNYGGGMLIARCLCRRGRS